LLTLFPRHPGVRSVVVVSLERISDSCGYGVPRYRHEGERTQLLDWAERKGSLGLVQYRAEKNLTSIDGLPGVKAEMNRENNSPRHPADPIGSRRDPV